MDQWINSNDFPKLQNIYDAFESLAKRSEDRTDRLKFKAYKNMVKVCTRMKEASTGNGIQEIEYLELRMQALTRILTLNSQEAVKPY